MGKRIPLPDGRRVDVDTFIEWRPWLWREAVLEALGDLNGLAGKSVLDLGCRYGRMTVFFALCGADAVGVDTYAEGLTRAAEFARQWQVEDRTRFIAYDGNPDALGEGPFDLIFTKSVLWSIPNLAEILEQIDSALAPNGRIAFVENVRGGSGVMWLRRNVIHRGRGAYLDRYHGITREQIPLFQRQFDDVMVRRRRFMIYTITGRKRTTHGSIENHAPCR